ncbi:MAG TPA: TetR/AcrR family transcriptional regulator [Thermoleophilaceae bacterium]
MEPSATRTLSTAEDRREAVLAAAMPVVAARGIHATPTAEIAKRAGISHAYLFRLFPTKSDLAIAVVERANQRIYDALAAAAASVDGSGEEKLHAMGLAYSELLSDRELLLLQLHSHASAAEDENIRDAARKGFERLVALVERESGADSVSVGRFFATGMLMNVMAALDAGSVTEHWADVLANYCKSEDGP